MRNFLCLIIIISLSCVGCQTNQLRAFEKVKTGMDKSEVLELMGGPTGSFRRNSLDRWRYQFYNDKQLYLKEIQFKEGKVFYFGDAVVSTGAAEQDDSKNEVSNAEVETNLKKTKEEAKQDLFKYEEKIKSEKGKYVPQFEKIK